MTRMPAVLLLSAACAGAPAQEFAPLFPVSPPQPFPDPERSFEEVRRLILDHYYSDDVNAEALWWAATRGMLRAVSPPEDPERATLWPPAAWSRVEEDLRGVRHASGISSTFNPADASLTVTAVEPDSPADGLLRPWDRILRIDGRPLEGLGAAAIESLLHGGEGEQVALDVVRGLEVLEVALRFTAYRHDQVLAQALPDGVLYTRLRGLSLGASGTLAAALAAHPREPGQPLSLVLDLRDNGGGVFVEGLRVAELFLPRNSILVRSVRRVEGLQNYVSANDGPVPARVAVLINPRTGSAAEAVAAALQSHGVATLVGQPSFGKATMEQTFTLSNDFRVKFIVGALYDPRGRSWQGKGLQPDLRVEAPAPLPPEVTPGERLRRDAAVAAAWHLLRFATQPTLVTP